MILKFNDFQLPQTLHSAIAKMNYTAPTPIQAQAIPPALLNRDVIGCAQTGTGKTAAFCIPLIAKLTKHNDMTALILTPTREIAAQIQVVLSQLTVGSPQLKHALLIGGAAMRPQIKALSQRPRILVATPGRLIDHLRQGTLSLSRAGILVLDEADRMLDMGFMPQINEILRFLPKTRQTLLFSATLPPEIEKLALRQLKDPVRVAVGAVSRAAATVTQFAVETTVGRKNEALLDELYAMEGSVLIFARTKRRTDRLARYLADSGYRVNRIHGDRTQAQRTNAIDGFRRKTFQVLVATDIAARGLDVDGVAHVVNYDLPMVPEDYVHRIGRTGRAGKTGNALSLVTPEDRQLWNDISRLLKKTGSGQPELRQRK